MKKQQKQYREGETVTWWSQAGGIGRNKTGKVVAIVPAGQDPAAVAQRLQSGGLTFSDRLGGAGARDEERYLVLVEMPRLNDARTAKKPRLYCPRVSTLKAASAK